MDITKIPEFHPRVDKVDVLSGNGQRAEGVSYRCSISQGRSKGTCVEEVSALMPMKSFTTTIPEDSWGLSKLFSNYVVDTVLVEERPGRTRITIRQHYATRGIKAKLVNLVAHRRSATQTADTLRAIKTAIEREGGC